MTAVRPTIPMTTIAGYLGSGKTTLLNRLIRERDASRFAILVNDFGKLNIDAELVEMEGGSAFRLENGCICCNIGDSLTTTLLQVLRMEPRPERILVEASGVAEPARIADIARLSPSLHPGRVVVLADSARIRAQLADPLIGETVRRQVEAADLLVLNKADLCAQEELIDVSAWLRSAFGARSVMTAAHAEIPAEDVLPEDAPTETGTERAAEPLTATPHSAVFWSWSYESEHLYERSAFSEALSTLAPILERAKGFLRFADAPDRAAIIQLTGSTITISQSDRAVSAGSRCRIVFIGAGARPDTATLEKTLDRARAKFATMCDQAESLGQTEA